MKKYKNKGFTLVELLVAIAIIGILASVVLISLLSQRNKAKFSNVVSGAASTAPYTAECYVRGVNLATAPNPFVANTAICAGAGINWPNPGFSQTGLNCHYGATTNTTFSIVCNTSGVAGQDALVTCDATTGACTQDVGTY